MSKITLYKGVGLTGDMKDFRDNEKELGGDFWCGVARSLKVQGSHWVGYTKENFQGDFVVYGAGEHDNLKSMDQQIRSIRLVTEDLKNPDIVLYEHINYGGKPANVFEEVKNLNDGHFNDFVSSHQVKQGVWFLYENTDLSGRRLITFQGDKWPNYCDLGWNDKLSSLRPLKSSDFEV